MKKKAKIILSLIVIFIIAFIAFGIYFIMSKKSEESKEVTNITNVTNRIEGYDYTLEDRDTDLFKTLFQELKTNLESEEINIEEYASSLAKLFVVDLFTINNKISKYDIGGIEYMYEGAKESFRSKVLDGIYKTVEDNSYETRKQNLPIVKSVEIIDTQNTTYNIDGTKYEAYPITISWVYEENLGYDNKAKITIIKEENKLSIVSYSPTK